MKNRKIISLTVLIVAIALMGILGLSKAFETAWQKENTIDNSLSAEMVERNPYSNLERTDLDYPFLTFEEFMGKSDEQVYIRYRDSLDPLWKSQLDWAVKKRENQKYYYPEPAMFTFQKIANKCGEIAKFTVGYTEHTKLPAVIAYYPADCLDGLERVGEGYDFTGQPYFYYEFLNESKDKALQFVVNAVTGEIITMCIDGEILIDYIDDLDYYYHQSEPSAEICKLLEEQTNHILDVLNIEDNIINRNYYFRGAFKHVLYNGGCYRYFVETAFSNGDIKTIEFLSDDNLTFQPYHYYTKPIILTVSDESIIYKNGNLTDINGNNVD